MFLYRGKIYDDCIYCGQRVRQSGLYISGIFEGGKRQQSQLGKKNHCKAQFRFLQEGLLYGKMAMSS